MGPHLNPAVIKEIKDNAEALKDRVRMLEELDRAGTKSRGEMHRQIEGLRQEVKEEFSAVAESLSGIALQLHTMEVAAAATKESCPSGDEGCVRADVAWLKQWMTWIGAGEVGLAAFLVTWLLTNK